MRRNRSAMGVRGLLLCAALAFLCPEASARDGMEAAVAGIRETFSGLRTFSCRFVQTNTISNGEVDAVLKGEMYYVASSGKTLWRYIAPVSYGILLENGSVDIRQGKRISEDKKVKKKELTERVTVLMNVLSPDNLRNEFDIKPSLEEGHVRISMSPVGKSARKNYRSITASFSAETYLVETVTVTRKNGDFMTIDFSNLKIDEPIDDGIFRIL